VSESGAGLEEDIAAAELRIHRRKQLLLAETEKAKAAVRSNVTSPSALLLAVGVGFTAGRITEGERRPGQSRLSRIWTAISGGVRAALQVVRAPTLVWLVRLFGTGKPDRSAAPEEFPPV
jgi:hypothetical protein